MTSPKFLTYEGDPSSGTDPYRPSLSDVGGAALIDDPDFPPDPGIMLTSGDVNQMEQLLVALAKVTPCALLVVQNAGVPSITGLRAASSQLASGPVVTAGSVTTCGDFTLTRHAAGDVEIQCPATKLIQPLAPIACTQHAGDYRASARINGTGDGIRVETRDASGSLVDVDFVAAWM